MTDDTKYVNADEAPPQRDQREGIAEMLRQEFIRQHHDLINPPFFNQRDRIKRSFARILRTWGETSVRISQQGK